MRERSSQRRRAARSALTATTIALVAVAFTSACVTDRDWRPVKSQTPETLKSERTLAAAALDPAAWPAESWWGTYGDPQLDTLMSAALAGSPSLQMAQARLRAAQGEATRISATLLPSTTVDAQTNYQRYPDHGLYPAPYAGHYFADARGALDLSYDLDFWGRNRQALAEASAYVNAADADRAAARIALTVAVAKAYFQLDLQYAFLDVALASLDQQTTILGLTRQRADKGLDTGARVRQAEASLALTRTAVEYTRGAIRLAQLQLSDLVAEGPDAALDLTRPRLRQPDQVAFPTRLPAELLGRRPDIVAQRWMVEAAAHGVRSAEAAFYPDVNLTAFAGLQSIGLSNFLEAGSTIVGIGPALSLPVFNRRALSGALETQQAAYDLSVAQYNQTLIDALNQVADVVTSWEVLGREAQEARTAEDSARQAYSLTQERFRAGLDDYLTVLSSENEVFVAQSVRAELVAQLFSLSADLVQALGGGYTPGDVPEKDDVVSEHGR